MKNERTQLTRSQFERMTVHFPCNQIIVRIDKKEIRTKSGIRLDFNDQTLYAEGEDSHIADTSTVMGTVCKQPERLYFNKHDAKSMSWETTLETCVGDICW